jgi:hypothetical protein
LLLCLSFTSITIFAQTANNSIDATGDIAFTAYLTNFSNGLQGFAFILLDNCPNNQSIGFIDEEWNGSSFLAGEGQIIWTNNTGATISKGTVIKIAGSLASNIAWTSMNTSVDAGKGSIAVSGTFSTGSGDQIFAMTGTRSSPGTLLAFVGGILSADLVFQNTPFGSGGNPTSNLVFNGQYATNVTTGSAYTGTPACNGTIAQCNTMINTAASWGSAGTFANVAAFFSSTLIPNSFTGTALPIELTRFEGNNKEGYNFLTWQTASESQNNGFDIERSTDGNRFEKIGFVAGKGTTNERQNYSFEDKSASGLVYYRLKQLDFDGRFEYSKIISIAQNGKNQASVFPNPSNGVFSIVGAEDIEEEQFTLINSIGQTIVIAGQNDQQLDLSAYPSGVYYLRVASSGQVMKLVKE